MIRCAGCASGLVVLVLLSFVEAQDNKYSIKTAQTPVPNVVGQKVKDAKKTLQQAGFNNIQIQGPQDDNAQVTGQNPPADQPSDPSNTTVILTTQGGGGGTLISQAELT